MWKKPGMNMVNEVCHCFPVRVCVDLRVLTKPAVRASREGFYCAIHTYSFLFSLEKTVKLH